MATTVRGTDPDAVKRYARSSRALLRQAQAELTSGDKRQASEKAWGAAALIVKAVAAQEGWEHETHRMLFRNVRKIVRMTKQPDTEDVFHIASSLHQNFYEDYQEAETVQRGIERVGVFVRRIEALLASSA